MSSLNKGTKGDANRIKVQGVLPTLMFGLSAALRSRPKDAGRGHLLYRVRYADRIDVGGGFPS